jgi:GT2 family glycosyltransferase
MNQALDFEWLRMRLPHARFHGAASVFSDKKAPQPVEAVSGACIMVHRRLFLDVGMFSTDYFMYAEDIDLCHKVRLAGCGVYLVNAAELIHFGGGSSKAHKNNLFGALLMREANFKLLRKFRGYRYALFYRVSVGCMGILRIAALFASLPVAGIIGNLSAIPPIIRRWGCLVLWAAGLKRIATERASGI